MRRDLTEALHEADEHRKKQAEETRARSASPNTPAERSERDHPPKKIRVVNKYDREY